MRDKSKKRTAKLLNEFKPLLQKNVLWFFSDEKKVGLFGFMAYQP